MTSGQTLAITLGCFVRYFLVVYYLVVRNIKYRHHSGHTSVIARYGILRMFLSIGDNQFESEVTEVRWQWW